MGRPTDYTPDLGTAIANLIAENRTLREIGEMEGMPDTRTITRWAVKFDDFAHKCAHARLQQAHAIVEKMQDIVDEVQAGELSSDQGRVILSAMQWIASKKNPKSYGDKMTLAGDAENPLFQLGKRMDQLKERRRALLEAPMINVTPVKELPAASSVELAKPGSDLC